MEVIEYFSDKNRDHWRGQIAQAPWGAAKFLLDLLNDQASFDRLLGRGGRLFLLVEGPALLSFVTLTRQDCIEDQSLFPWLGFFFTFPQYRGRRYGQRLLQYVENLARSEGNTHIYLGTDHRGLYEKYGYTYWESRPDFRHAETRIYKKSLS